MMGSKGFSLPFTFGVIRFDFFLRHTGPFGHLLQLLPEHHGIRPGSDPERKRAHSPR